MMLSLTILTILVLGGQKSQAVMFDWMMPNFLSSNQDSFSNYLGPSFRDGMNSFKDSMNSLKSSMEKMNSDFKQIRNKNYTINDLASVVYPNGYDNSSYYSVGSCSCVNQTCECCVHLEVDQLNLNKTACLYAVYLSSDVGINVQFTVDGVVYFNQTISVTNPPPVCFGVTDFKDAASLCLNFYDVVVRNDSFSGCLDITAKLAGTEVARVRVGCFRTAPNSKFYQQSIVSSHVPGNGTVYYNQFNSDSNSNLVLQTVSIAEGNLFSTTNSMSNKVRPVGNNNNFFSNTNRFSTVNLVNNNLVDDATFKRRKRD